MVSMGGRRLSLGVLRPFGVSLVSFAVVSLVIAPTLGDDVFGFEDGFGDLFELSPTLAAAVGAEDPGNETSEIEGETVPSPLAMDGITFVVPDSDLGDDRNRTRGANFSFELPAGWTATSRDARSHHEHRPSHRRRHLAKQRVCRDYADRPDNNVGISCADD